MKHVIPYVLPAALYVTLLVKSAQQEKGTAGVVIATVCMFIITGFIAALHLAIVNGRRADRLAEAAAKEREDHRIATLDRHRIVLTRKHRQLVFLDEYGRHDFTAWEKEMVRFHRSAFGNELHRSAVQRFAASVSAHVEAWLAEEAPDTLVVPTDPYEYERYCAEVLRRAGWVARVTQGSGDQGVDVIAEKGDLRVAIQCKLYTSPVGNKAVQEVHAASGFYDAPIAVVVSNKGYTRSAEQLAAKLKVRLLHHGDLPALEEMLTASYA